MKSFLKAVILVIMALVSNTAEQCISKYNDELCMDEMECSDYYEVNGIEEVGRDHCREFLEYYDNYGNYLPVNLVYKENEPSFENEIPRIQVHNSYEIRFHYNRLEYLDISSNNYVVMPKLAAMEKLRVLNISHNKITTAKLCSRHHLPRLDEINLSHNLINEIEINTEEEEYAFTTVTKLNISHNKITEIKEAKFNILTDLQYLDLSHNEISMINAFSFEGVKNLLYLNLAGNKIKEINSSLFRFTKLQFLYLNNNELSSILSADFRYFNKLREMDLSYNVISSVEKNVFDNMPDLISLTFKRNLLNYLDPRMFLNTTSLKSVDLSTNELDALPKNIFKGKNLYFFSVSQNILKGELIKGMFEGLSSVVELDISHQRLTYIGDFAFVGLDILEILNLKNNQIQNVCQNSFNSLRNLKYLDLSNNQISSLNFEVKDILKVIFLSLRGNLINIIAKGHFDGLNLMETLDISNNNISKVESYSFNDLSELVHFDISKNPLSYTLENNTFMGLNALPILDISCTSLAIIKNNSFNKMISLHTLNISRSTVNEINFNSFINTGNISVLDLSHNLLQTLDINTTTIMNLRMLYLDHNLILTLSADFFKGLTMLHTINLAHNKIQFLHDEIFGGLNNLAILDLTNNENVFFNSILIYKAYNIKKLYISGTHRELIFDRKLAITDLDMSKCNITNVTSICLNVLQDLDRLTMNNNNIEKLEVGAFNNLTKLSSIDMSHNKLAFIQPGVFKDNYNLKILNISHNQLNTLSFGIFCGLSQLSKLDVSYNELIELKSERFYGIESLSTLIVDFNKISDIDVQEFSLPLSVLSIGGNLIHCSNVMQLKKIRRGTTITAIKLNDTNSDNIDGISCIGHVKSNYKPRPLNGTENILFDIRDILYKLSTESKNNNMISNSSDEKLPINLNILTKSMNQTISNAVHEINYENNVSSKYLINSFNQSLQNTVMHEQSVSNSLLERILKMVVAFKTEQTTPFPILQLNTSHENIGPMIAKIKQDFENAITIEKEKILAEVSDKIISIVNKKMDDMSKIKSVTEKIVQAGNEPKTSIHSSLLVMVICVAILLTVLLCFTIYKIYKHILSPSQRSYSTQHFVDAIENSNL